MKSTFLASSKLPRSEALHLSRRILEEMTEHHHPERFNVRFWDGSFWPSSEPREATLILRHPSSLREMFLKGTERALGESYLSGACDIEGNMEAVFELADLFGTQSSGWMDKLAIGRLLRQLPAATSVESCRDLRKAHLNGSPHSLRRDREAIQFHYDISNDFYSLWLDPAMVYSCAYFENKNDNLKKAQQQKLDHICRKLSLQKGQRLLDIGSGWGGLIIHAASKFGVRAVGITLSERQAEYARNRISNLGLQNQVEVRIADYRELKNENYDAISSVGMVEHVGEKNLPLYFRQVFHLLKEGGLFLNHGIGAGGPRYVHFPNSFVNEYVFPDGDLCPLAEMLSPAEEAGFEIRDVENLREHYAFTLRHWVKQLEENHKSALQFVNEPIYRIWRLYMAGSAHYFNVGQLAIYQTLLAKLKQGGRASVTLTRRPWYPAQPELRNGLG